MVLITTALITAVWLIAMTVVAMFWGNKIIDRVVNKILDRYEDRVTRQSLAEARRLVDANRRYPVRSDSGAPAVIHRGLKKK